MSVPYNTAPQSAQTSSEQRPSRHELAIATTLRRAETLLTTDGYDLQPHPSLRAGLYLVVRPEQRIDTRTGEIIDAYEVDLVAASCTCEQWRYNPGKNCKHLRSVQAAIARAYNLLAPMLSQAGLTIPPAQQSAPEAQHPAPAPVRVVVPRVGNGKPYCQRCQRAMDLAKRVGTADYPEQHGNLCTGCGNWLEEGTYTELRRVGGKFWLHDGTYGGRQQTWPSDDLAGQRDLAGQSVEAGQ